MYINIPNDNTTSRILLKDVLHAPMMCVTLVSISRITQAGSLVLFKGDYCQIFDRKRRQVGKIEVKGGLYRVYQARDENSKEFAGKAAEVMTINELHHCMGHIAPSATKLLVEKNLVNGIQLDLSSEATVCESCEWAKSVWKSIQKVQEGKQAESIGDKVHADLWGPAPVATINHKEYYVSFTNDHSCYSYLYLLRTKDKTYDAYLCYEAWLRTQKQAVVKGLHTDRGGEFLSKEFSAHLAKQGTV